jgi:hypothetical protein
MDTGSWAIEWTDTTGHHQYRQGTRQAVVAWANHLGREGVEVTIYAITPELID